jgi:hypothetical protein
MGVWIVLMLPMGLPGAAGAADWSVGASGGFNQFFAQEGSFQSSGGGIPFSGPSLEFHPGLRVERRAADGRTAVFLEGGFAIHGAKDAFATRSTILTLQGLRAIGGYDARLLYVVAGGGLGYFSYEDLSSFGSLRVGGAGAIFGVGLGYSRMLANEHGRWRGEIRYARVEGVTGDGLAIVPRGHAVSAQLGFDLIVN